MNFTTTTPTRPGVVIGTSVAGIQAVYIEGFYVGELAAEKFRQDRTAIGRTGRTGHEAEAHEIARRLDGQHFPDWLSLREAIKSQELYFCDAHGESESYRHCTECREAERMAEALAS